MSNIDKMHRVNAILKKELEKEGMTDIQMFPHTRWNKDIFGMWDAVGYRDNDVVWIQFKSGYCSDMKKYKKWCDRFYQVAVIAQYIPFIQKKKNGKGKYVKRRAILVKFNW
jgi:hypothetical protein